jgi:hypothetical protein
MLLKASFGCASGFCDGSVIEGYPDTIYDQKLRYSLREVVLCDI